MSQAAFDTPTIIHQKLHKLRRSIRQWIWIDGLSQLALWAAIILLVDLGIDRVFRMDRAQRGVMLLVMLIPIAMVLWWRLIKPLIRTVTDDALAARVEAQHDQLNQQMISALQFARMQEPTRGGASPQLIRETISKGNKISSTIAFDDVVDRSGLRRNLMRGTAAVGFIILLSALFPATMRTWWQRNILVGTQQWPQQTQLVFVGVVQDELVVPRGDDVTILVRANGVVPETVTLAYRSVEGGKRITEQMVKIGRDTYRLTIRNVLEPHKLQARGGDGLTPWIHMQLVNRPEIEQLTLTVTPPAYTNQAIHDLPTGRGAYYVPAGSSVRIHGRANKPLSRASLQLGKEFVRKVELRDDDPQRFSTQLTPEDLRDGTYGIVLTDTIKPDPLMSRQPIRFSIRIREDETPTVRAQLMGIGDMIVNRAVVPIKCRLTDDYVIVEASLKWQQQLAESDQPRSGSHSLSAVTDEIGKKRIGPFVHEFDIEPIDLVVGEHVTFHLTAMDNDTVTGPKTGESTLFSLKVVSEQELRAELLRREQEQRLEFARLLADQQELLVAVRATQAGLRNAAAVSPSTRRDFVAAERRQRLVAGRCQAIARQFTQILAEVANNRLEEKGGPIHRRIQSRIVSPLMQLAHETVPRAADTLDQAVVDWQSEQIRNEKIAFGIDQQRQIIADMQTILRSMVKLEGYQEAINLVREIVKEQTQVEVETRKALEKRISDIFDD